MAQACALSIFTFSFLKSSSRSGTSCLVFNSRVSVRHTCNILQWSFTSDKYFLIHIIKEIRLWKQARKRSCIMLRTVSTVQRCHSGMSENRLAAAYTWKNMICSSWLVVRFSSHVKNATRDIRLAFWCLNENLATGRSRAKFVYCEFLTRKKMAKVSQRPNCWLTYMACHDIYSQENKSRIDCARMGRRIQIIIFAAFGLLLNFVFQS